MTAPTSFDVSAALDRPKLGSFGLRIVILSWLVTFFDGFDLNVIAYLSKPLQADFGLTTQMLGNVFSIGIFGTFLGGFLFGYLGDRMGRRPAILFATAGFSALTFAIALSPNYPVLLALRFVNGLALGGALPLIWSLNIEFAPKRLRATIITLTMLGYGMGVTVAGPIARLVLPHYSWPGVFVVGAILSFGATILLFFNLPESPRFLVSRQEKPDAIKRILARMGISTPEEPVQFVLSDEAQSSGGQFRVSMLFEGALRWLTPLLWLSYFTSSVSIFFITSWSPLILEDLGFTADQAAWIASMNSLFSAAGGLSLMRFTDRFGPISVAVLPLSAVPLLLVAGLAPISLTVFLVLLVPISIFLGGSHYGIQSILGFFYPSKIRANGTGWCSGVAKIGSTIGPLIGGYVLATSLPVQMTYALLAICPLIYGLAVLSIGLIVRRAHRV